MTDIHMKNVAARDDDKSEKKLFRQLFIRQFPLLGTMNFTRMEGLSYGWALAPMLKKIYPDPHRYMEALKRNSQFFNNPASGTVYHGPDAVDGKRERGEP
jgi:PTS system mannose-specific IID component